MSGTFVGFFWIWPICFCDNFFDYSKYLCFGFRQVSLDKGVRIKFRLFEHNFYFLFFVGDGDKDFGFGFWWLFERQFQHFWRESRSAFFGWLYFVKLFQFFWRTFSFECFSFFATFSNFKVGAKLGKFAWAFNCDGKNILADYLLCCVGSFIFSLY